jgi:hypothetical protein
MKLQSNERIRLFDKFSLIIPKKLKYHMDGVSGHRVLFVTDQEETINISFEEGMRMSDVLSDTNENAPKVVHRCCRAGKYIHQRHSNIERCVFFHIELEDDDGKTLYLPGQMVVSENYQWSDGVEPVLLNLLEGIDVCRTKDRET